MELVVVPWNERDGFCVREREGLEVLLGAATELLQQGGRLPPVAVTAPIPGVLNTVWQMVRDSFPQCTGHIDTQSDAQWLGDAPWWLWD